MDFTHEKRLRLKVELAKDAPPLDRVKAFAEEDPKADRPFFRDYIRYLRAYALNKSEDNQLDGEVISALIDVTIPILLPGAPSRPNSNNNNNTNSQNTAGAA